MTSPSALDVMKARRSCRAYSSALPDKALLQSVCEAGTWAPTGHGKQSPIILAVTDPDLRNHLSRLNAQVLAAASPHPLPDGFDPFYGAPAILVVLADSSVPTYLYDGCAVLTNMANAAQAVGLASCWVHRAKEVFQLPEGRQVLRNLGVDDRYQGIDNLAIGYAAIAPKTPLPRKTDYIRWV